MIPSGTRPYFQTFDSCVRFSVVAFSIVLLDVRQSSSWSSDGLCPEPLGQPVNNFLDQCFRGHHFFSAMRAYNLRYLYKVNCCHGYREISRGGGEVRCQAECTFSCINGACVRPETCECRRGYFLKSQYLCLPLCHPSCRNGDCVGVDECSCLPGYRKANGSRSDCEPVCTPECVHGRCVFPGVCECDSGYKFKSGSSRVCEPRCDFPCVNGICTSPNTCQCTTGYGKVSLNVCEPICRSGCGAGTCSAPNSCSCPTGYKTSSGQSCEPVCEGCHEGSCASPGTCLCPKGRELDEKTGNCVRTCDPPCVHGDCVEPRTCACWHGYVTKPGSNTCEPVCSPSCRNGRCVQRDRCECYTGFRLVNSSWNECEAICTRPCVNGTCVAPDLCQCWTGYTQIANDTCIPTCANGCGPGTCVSPDVCACPVGYESRFGEACTPVCSSCDLGLCVEPGVCICPKGFSWDESSGKCSPMCAKPCVNASCVSPGRCVCLDGYAPSSDSTCAPTCVQECTNGQCTSPDFCTCSPGFNKHPENRSLCLPQLRRHSQQDSTIFLNHYNFSSVILYYDDNETFAFTKQPQISVQKDCKTLFPSLDITAENRSNTDFLILNCQLLSELNDQLYCQWPTVNSDTVSIDVDNSSMQNISLTERRQYLNLTLDLLFPEKFASEESGYCTLCIVSALGMNYFSFNEMDFLLVRPCTQDNTSEFQGATLTEKENFLVWLTATAGGILTVVIVSSIIVYTSLRKVELSSLSKYAKTENSESVEIFKEDSGNVCKGNQINVDKKGVAWSKSRCTESQVKTTTSC